MNKKIYSSAMKNIKTSLNFNEKTIELLSSKEIEKEKYDKKNNHKYFYGIAIASLFIILFTVSMLSNPTIELENSTGNISVKYIDKVPNIYTSSDLIWLSEDEIFNKYNTSIFQGEVIDIKNIKIKMGIGSKEYRAIATIKILENYRGNQSVGEHIKILLPCPIKDKFRVEDTEVVSAMNVGTIGIFMPIKYDKSHIYKENNATLYLIDISEYGFLDGERFAFIETENGVVYADWAFENISKNSSLVDIKKYILDMIE